MSQNHTDFFGSGHSLLHLSSSLKGKLQCFLVLFIMHSPKPFESHNVSDVGIGVFAIGSRDGECSGDDCVQKSRMGKTFHTVSLAHFQS